MKCLYVRATKKKVMIRTRKAQLGEIKQNNRKVKRKNEGRVLLLRLTSTLQPV